MKIKHSKYKNTGILFELLIRQITSDTLNNKNSPASDILKEFFVKSELGKEYKLYKTIINSKNLNENKANSLIEVVLDASKNINRSKLRKEKYNLVKSIKEHYNLENFFSLKISNYKELASIYTLIEHKNSKSISDFNQVVNNKHTLLEHLVGKPLIKEENELFKEYNTYDKDLKILTYKILLEKFNSKYDSLPLNQKQILREYINSVDSSSKLKSYYNNKVEELNENITKNLSKIEDKTTVIKIQETLNYLKPLSKTEKVKSDHLIDLMQYSSLINEINNIS